MSCWTKRGGLYWIDTERLAAHLRARGLSVTVVPGAATRGAVDSRGRRGFPVKPGTLLDHHTATPDTYAGDYPSLRVVRDGRTGLPGPLAQFGLGRSGRVYVIAAGLAWHAGAVGSTAWDNWHAVGIEAEDNGTDSKYPAAWYAAYARLNAALMEPAGLDLGTLLGHKEAARPRGRKIDPVFSMDAMRAEVGKIRAGAGTKPPTTPPPTSGGSAGVGVLRYGDTGAAVKQLQTELRRLFPRTFGSLAVDGSYGNATRQAVETFQRNAAAERRYDSTVDGILGPKTRAALSSYGAKLL